MKIITGVGLASLRLYLGLEEGFTRQDMIVHPLLTKVEKKPPLLMRITDLLSIILHILRIST